MKEPNEITGIIKGRVYTVPTYYDEGDEVVNGQNTSLKLYCKGIGKENSGINPLSLMAVIINHFEVQPFDENKESALSRLHHAYDAIQELNEE